MRKFNSNVTFISVIMRINPFGTKVIQRCIHKKQTTVSRIVLWANDGSGVENWKIDPDWPKIDPWNDPKIDPVDKNICFIYHSIERKILMNFGATNEYSDLVVVRINLKKQFFDHFWYFFSDIYFLRFWLSI